MNSNRRTTDPGGLWRHRRGAPGALVCLVAAALAAPAGCEPTSETAGGRYTHNGLRFSVAVPEGWTVEELGGDLVVELRGPAAGDGPRAVAHVFARGELRPVDLDRVAEEARELVAAETSLARIEGDDEAGDANSQAVTVEACEVAGLAARRIVRPVRSGAATLQQELIIAAKGRQAWALVLTGPADPEPEVAAAIRAVRETFRVW